MFANFCTKKQFDWRDVHLVNKQPHCSDDVLDSHTPHALLPSGWISPASGFMAAHNCRSCALCLSVFQSVYTCIPWLFFDYGNTTWNQKVSSLNENHSLFIKHSVFIWIYLLNMKYSFFNTLYTFYTFAQLTALNIFHLHFSMPKLNITTLWRNYLAIYYSVEINYVVEWWKVCLHGQPTFWSHEWNKHKWHGWISIYFMCVKSSLSLNLLL